MAYSRAEQGTLSGETYRQTKSVLVLVATVLIGFSFLLPTCEAAKKSSKKKDDIAAKPTVEKAKEKAPARCTLARDERIALRYLPDDCDPYGWINAQSILKSRMAQDLALKTNIQQQAINMEYDIDTELTMRMAAICDHDAAAKRLHGLVLELWSLIQLQGMESC